MRTVLATLALLLILPDADGQLFRRRGRPSPDCPDCRPGMPSEPWTPYKPIPGPAPTPAPAPTETGEPTLTELDAILPVELRNRNPGIECAYIAAEECLVAAGYEEFKGWGTALPTRRYDREMGPILKAMDERGIEYVSTRNGDMSVFEHARKLGVPVYVQIPGHALTVLALTPRYAYVVNNLTAANPASLEGAESGSKKVWKWPRAYFDRAWERVAFCVKCRKKPKPDAAKPLPAPMPTPIPAAGPKGDPGPAGPAGKDGTSVDTAALVNQISQLIDQKLDARLAQDHGKLVLIEQRLAVLEGRPARLASRIEQVAPQ